MVPFTNKQIINWFAKYLLVFVIGGISLMTYAQEPPLAKKPTKTSEIPAKRVFPINNNINPCVNFYEYACSPVIDSFSLREDRSRHDFAFSDATERLLDFKKKYFANLAQKRAEIPLENEIKDYYLACMDQKGRTKEEQDFVARTKELLKNIKTREEFTSFIAKNITDPSNLSFIDFATTQNLDRPSYNDLFFDTHLMSLPERSYYENKQLTKELKELIEYFFVTIGEDSPKQKANLVFKFEKELAQNYPTPPTIRKRAYSRTQAARKKLIKNYPDLKLKEFLANIPKHVVIRNIIGNSTMEFLERKLKTATLEELKTVFLYFQLKSIMDDAYPDFFAKKFEFNRKYLGGPNQRPDRQERCTMLVMGDFNKEVDFVLLPKLFPDFPKEKFIKSIEKIRIALLDQLNKNSWLDPNTKQEAIRKIKKVGFSLVSPNNEEEWDFNPRSSYTTDAPIANSIKLAKLLIDKHLKELEGPLNTNRWEMGPLTVNAYYDPSYNKIVFPVGILQYPFYDPSEPEEVNLGAIGAVIGHELGHAIDDQGNNFNADGVLKPWMSNKDKKLFDKKSHYLIKQFKKIGHNGEFTLGENIGDLVGLSTAYQAAFPQNNNVNQDLQKRFFLQYARIWCGVEREGFTKRRLKTNPHALGSARTNEQIKHQIGFKEAYNCKPNDPMVIPENEVVKIW